MRENHLALDGHHLLQTVQGYLTLLGRGEVVEERSENFIKDTRTWVVKGGGEGEERRRADNTSLLLCKIIHIGLYGLS